MGSLLYERGVFLTRCFEEVNLSQPDLVRAIHEAYLHAGAQVLCTNVPDDERFHYVQPGVGHYGVFNGTRWRTEIQPRLRQMIRSVERKRRVGTKVEVKPYIGGWRFNADGPPNGLLNRAAD
jgi:hypothetical protein